MRFAQNPSSKNDFLDERPTYSDETWVVNLFDGVPGEVVGNPSCYQDMHRKRPRPVTEAGRAASVLPVVSIEVGENNCYFIRQQSICAEAITNLKVRLLLPR